MKKREPQPGCLLALAAALTVALVVMWAAALWALRSLLLFLVATAVFATW